MIKLLILVLLFLLSLLAIFKAPEYYLWLISIIVTEFPLIFAIITILILALGSRNQRFQEISLVLGLIAFILFISPVIRSYLLSKTLKNEINIVFNDYKNTNPFSFSKLFSVAISDVSFKSLPYYSADNSFLNLDFYSSIVTGKRPCIIIVHGGSWAKGSSRQLPQLNSYLAKKGYHIASINYRLAPYFKNPAPINDVKSAIVYLKRNSEKLNIDTTKFVLIGRSAGAQIALLAAYSSHIEGLKGVVDFYGPADMVWGYSLPANPLIMDSRKVMEDYIGGSYDIVPQQFINSSPIEFVSKFAPPTLIIHGENDVLVAYEHSKRLKAQLEKLGIPNYFLSLPWATHGFDFNINGPSGQLSTFAVEKFLSSVTK